MKSAAFLATTAACLGTSTAFAPAPHSISVRSAGALSSLSLSMKNDDDRDDSGKTFAASAIAAAYIFTGLLSPVNAAFAMDGSTSLDYFGSSNVIAARSGGRAGGRAPARAAPRAAPSSSASSSKTVINRSTTVIQATPPVVVGSPYGYGGGYYDPTPGIALNLGLSAVSSISNGMRESRQNDMIYQERAELQAAREREADMAARIRELERMQMQQGGNSSSGQAPVVYVQPPMAQQQVVPSQ
mmetsp:Transcript_31397/g.65617  ORF Transcript_31397/g.65617 Transcript_31397/m.65617 type:complete len:243 (-) Transcript_31397:69-797(-)